MLRYREWEGVRRQGRRGGDGRKEEGREGGRRRDRRGRRRDGHTHTVNSQRQPPKRQPSQVNFKSQELQVTREGRAVSSGRLLHQGQEGQVQVRSVAESQSAVRSPSPISFNVSIIIIIIIIIIIGIHN